MISKKLLSEVLGYDACPLMAIEVKRDGCYSPGINIHELAHKCKEWAKTKEYSINSGNRLDGTERYDVLCVAKDADIEEWDDFFSGMFDTEPEAIFKACEWILENA